MIRPIEEAPICPHLEDVAVRIGLEVLMVANIYFTDCW
jgi:hypothetical protein